MAREEAGCDHTSYSGLYIQEAAAAVHAVCMHATEVLLLESGRAGPASHCYHQRAASTPTSMCPPYTGIGIYIQVVGVLLTRSYPLYNVISLTHLALPVGPLSVLGVGWGVSRITNTQQAKQHAHTWGARVPATLPKQRQ